MTEYDIPGKAETASYRIHFFHLSAYFSFILLLVLIAVTTYDEQLALLLSI